MNLFLLAISGTTALLLMDTACYLLLRANDARRRLPVRRIGGHRDPPAGSAQVVAPAGNASIKRAAAPDLRQASLGANEPMTALYAAPFLRLGRIGISDAEERLDISMFN